MVAEASARHKGGRLRIQPGRTAGSRRCRPGVETRKSRPEPLSPRSAPRESGRTTCLPTGSRVALSWSRRAGFDPLSPSVESRARRGPARTRHEECLRSLPARQTTRMTSMPRRNNVRKGQGRQSRGGEPGRGPGITLACRRPCRRPPTRSQGDASDRCARAPAGVRGRVERLSLRRLRGVAHGQHSWSRHRTAARRVTAQRLPQLRCAPQLARAARRPRLRPEITRKWT